MRTFYKIGSIGRRLLLASLAFTLIPLFIIGWIAVNHETNTIREHIFVALEVIADYTGNEVLDRIKYLKGRTQDFSSDGFIRDSIEDINNHHNLDNKVLSELNLHLANNKLPIVPDAVETFVLNRNGVVVSSSNKSKIGKIYKFSDLFVKGSKNVYASDIFIDNVSDQPTWLIAAPLKGRTTGEFIGVIANRIDHRILNRIIENRYSPHLDSNKLFNRIAKQSHIYIVNRNSLMLTNSHLENENDAILRKIVDTNPVRYAKKQKNGMVDFYPNYLGVETIGASKFINEMNWLVLTEIDKSVAFLPIKQFISKVSIAAVLLILVILVLMFFTSKRIVNPIISIAKTFNRIAKGHWDERVIIKDKNSEIADLAIAFNSIVDSFLDTFSSLLESEKRFYSVVEDMPVLINAFDENRNFIVWNRECERVIGYNSEVIVNNKEALELIYPGHANHDYVLSKWVYSDGDYRDWEMQMTGKDGSIKSILWSNMSKQFPIPGWEKWVVGIDITKRKQMKRELVEKTIYLDNILRSSADIAFVAADVNYRFKYFNPMAEKIFGFRADEIIGRTASEMQKRVNFDPKPFIYAVKNINNNEEQCFIIEQNKDGELQYIETRISGIFDIDIKLIGIVLVAQDITERKKTEYELNDYVKKLAASNSELEQFAYVASHDLQEPLRMISSYLQLLERRYKGKLDEDANEFIWYAVDGADRMQKLINALLAYSRVGTRGKEFESIDCENVLKQVLINLQPAINESETEIINEGLPVVMADKTQMGQLFQNLIANAIKFRGDLKPIIKISAKAEGEFWHFCVSDNGIGIEKDQYKRIFLMFQRLHTRKEFPGTGIGLALCKKIVERHGGQIWVESEFEKGTSFCFTIPNREELNPA